VPFRRGAIIIEHRSIAASIAPLRNVASANVMRELSRDDALFISVCPLRGRREYIANARTQCETVFFFLDGPAEVRLRRERCARRRQRGREIQREGEKERERETAER